jgi:hypothetical protein
MSGSDSELIKEINGHSIGDRCKLLYSLFQSSVRMKYYDEIWQTDGCPVEILSVEDLILLGHLLKDMSENNGMLYENK